MPSRSTNFIADFGSILDKIGTTMKKIIFLTLVLTLLLTACGGSAEPVSGAGNGTQFDPTTRQLPLSTKLAIGTLKLENTDLAVASDQAAELLPLWQVINNLSSSDNAAQDEITAVTEQIQETMTPEQLNAIEDMGLSGQDIFTTMQELGIEGAQRVNASGTPQAGGFGNGQRPEGGFPGGGPPGGGPGGEFSDQNFTPEQIATMQARRAENGGSGFGNRMMTPLVEAVIKLLESKVQ
jgi:hypothetical protein